MRQSSVVLGDDLAPEGASGLRDVALTKARRHMVSCANPHAAEAGQTILVRGGSAIDAAIAVQATLNLVEPQSSGIGGGGFLLYYDASQKRTFAYDGRETAPAAATPELFLDANGAPMPFFDAVVGGRSVGAPGILRMLESAHARHGNLPWNVLFDDAIQLAREGFPVSPRLADMLAADPHLAKQDAARAYFYAADGSPPEVGARLRNPQFAKTLQTVANGGADAFYTGALAQQIVDTVRASRNPGTLSLADLATYQVKTREPISITYRGYRIVAPPPPSGGLVTLQILKLLEPIDLGNDPQSPQFLHLLAEAERLAYADRERYLADADVVAVPTAELLAPAYLQQRSSLIDPQRATPNRSPGSPTADVSTWRDGHALSQACTTHLSIVDAQGNVASMTSSVENAFGSRLMVGGLLLNNQLTDFSFKSTAVDGGSVANAVAPKKRPRSSMSPIIVFDKNDQPILALGSPGGSRIIGYVAQTIVHVLDFGLDVQTAINLPRVLNRNGKTEIEDHPHYRAQLDRLVQALSANGHEISRTPHASGIHAIQISPTGITGGADPRREGVSLGR